MLKADFPELLLTELQMTGSKSSAWSAMPATTG